MKNIGLVPLRNFALVDEAKQIYRSAQPLYIYEYEWMVKVLGIKTIFNLRPEKIDDRLLRTLGNITIITIAVEDHYPPTLEQAKYFMKEIVHLRMPSLIHCTHGHGRTSTFCVLARLALGWSLDKALKEENEKFHYAFHHKVQEEFLRNHFQ